jgi:ligand-binding SRPBCC domain-containing protein
MIAAPAGDCFRLSLSVDAHAASMRASGERAVRGVTSGVLELGDTVTWRARHFGIVFRMTSAITEYEYPVRFVDEQQRGPFRRWRHEHTFAAADGGTRMIDVAEFQSPLGPAGTLADYLVLDRYLRHLLIQRNAWLRATLEAAVAETGLRLAAAPELPRGGEPRREQAGGNHPRAPPGHRPRLSTTRGDRAVSGGRRWLGGLRGEHR